MGKFNAAPKAAAAAGAEAAKPSNEQLCHACSGIFIYPGSRDPRPPGNRIVGRSITGGYVCRDCYERGEHFDYRDKAAEEFRERHRDDEWGTLISASYHLESREDRVDLLAALRRHARKIGSPEAVDRARSASAGRSRPADEEWFRQRGMAPVNR